MHNGGGEPWMSLEKHQTAAADGFDNPGLLARDGNVIVHVANGTNHRSGEKLSGAGL